MVNRSLSTTTVFVRGKLIGDILLVRPLKQTLSLLLPLAIEYNEIMVTIEYMKVIAATACNGNAPAFDGFINMFSEYDRL